MRSFPCLTCVAFVGFVLGCTEENGAAPKADYSNLYSISQKAAELIKRKDTKAIDVDRLGNSDHLLRIYAIGGEILEERAYIEEGTSFIRIADQTAIAFIRDDAGECLILWKDQDWNLASVKIFKDDMTVEWTKRGDFRLYTELLDFSKRSVCAYQEL